MSEPPEPTRPTRPLDAAGAPVLDADTAEPSVRGGRPPARRARPHGTVGGIRDPDPALEPLDAGERAALGVVARRHEHAREHELEVQARRGRAGHLGEGLVDEVGDARELGRAECRGLRGHALELVFGHAAQHGRGRRGRRRRDDDEVAQPLEQVFDEAPRILAGLHDAVDCGERPRGIPRADRVDDLVEQGAVRVAEQRHRALVVDRGALGPGDELVEQRQRVARRAAAGAHDERQHAGLDLTPSSAQSCCTYSSIGAGGTSRNG